MGFGMLIGLTALRLSADPVGGVVEAAATILFGSFFLLSLGKAWWYIRNGHVDLHREWSTRMVAIALGVATTRPIMGVFFATSALTGLSPQQFFGPAMWLGFLSTYLAGEAWIKADRSAKSVNKRKQSFESKTE
jgi:ABC-type enterochelin transport system permease subunit